jgi:hypothetical protein
VLSWEPENALSESESNLQSSRGAWEHLELLGSTGEVYRSVWQVCMWLAHRFTFCWYHFTQNDILNYQCGCLVSVIIFLIQDNSFFTLHWPSCSGCSRECVSVHYDFKCSQYNKHRQWHIKNNILHLTVDIRMRPAIEKPENENWRLQLKSQAKPGQPCGLKGTGMGLACKEVAGQGFGHFWNKTETCIWSKLGPLAAYPDLVLTLSGSKRWWIAYFSITANY